MIFGALICAVCVSLNAQNIETKEVATPNRTLADLQMGYSIARYAYEHQSAPLLVEAANIVGNISLAALQYESMERSNNGSAIGNKASKMTFDAMTMLADAKKLAGKDASVVAKASEVERAISEKTKRSVDGPYYHTDIIYGKSTDTYRVKFRGGESAEVLVSGDGDTDLDLYIYDANGNLIDKDVDYTDDCVCIWTPRRTGTFTIKIVNRGRISNRYVLATN